jgi:hypothetical protein
MAAKPPAMRSTNLARCCDRFPSNVDLDLGAQQPRRAREHDRELKCVYRLIDARMVSHDVNGFSTDDSAAYTYRRFRSSG